ncbi:MAG TPA: DUF983 domain-containing protein [Pyrinomonadaceae bacterium]|jgi:uncharacterized protein (DUF983 family)
MRISLEETRRTLLRGLRLKCPVCGRGDLYQSAFRLNKSCASCGLVFEREQGYFVGSIYINVIATEAVILLIYVFALITSHADSDALYVALFVLALVLPPLFVRFSWGLWLSIDHLISPR